MELGLYYSNDIYHCDVESSAVFNIEKMDANQYIMVEENGIRLYGSGGLGVYHGWTFIGDFLNYKTYILTNNSKICIAPEINGIYYFYEKVYDFHEYKKLIEFRNLNKVSNRGDYIMEK
tara:strand:- start:2515 stop:2871 length:357 start_codon:yes stop_codon:yes gene_type:complete